MGWGGVEETINNLEGKKQSVAQYKMHCAVLKSWQFIFSMNYTCETLLQTCVAQRGGDNLQSL